MICCEMSLSRGLTPNLLVSCDFETIGKETFDRRIPGRRFVQDAQHFHPLVDIDVGDRIAIDAGDDGLGDSRACWISR